MIIQKQSELADFCEKLAENPYLTIDTEFLRDKTYYSRLCLIQMAGPGIEAAAIDPIEFDLDLTPFWELMLDKSTMKVFHAARQDLEIFYQEIDALPAPIFDTQVAAMVCGYGDSIAYNALVKNVTGTELAKSAQFTDWSRRPLSGKQLSYALDDVIHLRGVYESLQKQLAKRKRENWVFEEMEILTSTDTYKMDPQDAWKRIKIRSDKPKVLSVLKALAAWREEDARTRNVPRGRILRDDTLADLALYLPKNTDGLLRIRSLPKDMAKGRVGKILLELIEKAKNAPEDQMPKRPRREPLPASAQPALEMLKLLLKINCSEEGVATKLVATKDDLEILATEKNPDSRALKGWRKDIFGQDALAMLSGDLSLTLKDGTIKKVYS